MKNNKKKTRSWLAVPATIVLVFLGAFLIPLSAYIDNFGLDQLMFYIRVPLSGSNNSTIWEVVNACFPFSAYVTAIVLGAYLIQTPRRAVLEFSVFGRKLRITLFPFEFLRKRFVLCAAVIFTLGFFWFDHVTGFLGYIFSSERTTSIFEDEYVDPRDVNIQFPEEKRNLIYIYLESMESSYADVETGGLWETNLIPNLTRLAEDHISFSGTDRLGGAIPEAGSSWTMGALVAHTSGLPLKLPVDGNSYGEFTSFLPGVTSLNDILSEQGYRQVFMIGSDADFGGRSNYFAQHGNVELWDIKYAKEIGVLPEDYHVFWGYEDQKLYGYAQDKLLELAAGDEPFNLTLLTVDTHFYDGYLCPVCEEQWPSQYENVISCADRQVMAFVEWIQQQAFYENTTIVIAGDHITMDSEFFTEKDLDANERRTYNCFINVAVSPSSSEYERIFSTLDFFPSTLAAMGVTWEGSRLGLGTNLFSGEPTLPEKTGWSVFYEEVRKTSHFYNNELLYPKGE